MIGEQSEHDGTGRFIPGGRQGPGRGPAAGAPNAGRPKDAVRAAARLAFEERLEKLCAIADGTQQALRPGPGGSWSLVTGSTIDEMIKAILGLAKMGGVEQIAIELGDDEEEMDTRTRYGIILMPPPEPKPVPPADGSCWSPAPGYSP